MVELRWMADDGTNGSRMFESDDAAMTAAKAVEGVAMVTGLRRGRPSTYRHGNELSGEDALARQGELHS
jgi:hypothetical protein